MSEQSDLASRLKANKKSRLSYLRAKLSVNIASQIRALRLKFPMTQQALADESDMKQSRISAVEKPGAVAFNLETLIRLAAAFKVALIVKFVPFSELLNWENEFSQDTFEVVKIDDDLAFSASQRPAVAAQAAIREVAESQVDLELGDRLISGIDGFANKARVRGSALGLLSTENRTPSRWALCAHLDGNIVEMPGAPRELSQSRDLGDVPLTAQSDRREMEGAKLWNYSMLSKQGQFGCSTLTS